MTDTPDASQFWQTPAPQIGGGANLTPAQAREMASELVKHGALTPADAEATLIKGRNESAPADTRGDDAKNFDATFAPAPTPENYKLDFIGRLPPGTEIQTVAEFNQFATGWLNEIGFPPSIGTSLIESAMDAGQRAARMSPPQRELWKREQAAIFDRIAKTPERAALLRAHAELVLASAAKRADFTQALQRSPGAIHDASVLMNLALHGERLAARRAMK